MSNMLVRLQEVDHNLIEAFIRTKKSETLPEDLQGYIIKINALPSIIHYNGTAMTTVAREIQKQFPGMSFSSARELYYDAMNYFYVDDTITADAWDNYYADQYEKLARIAIAMNKLDTASKCWDKAHALRTQAAARIKPSEWEVPVFIVTSKIRPEDLGLESQKVYDVLRKAEDGYYAKLIEGLHTTQDEKNRMRIDAGIEDVAFKEVKEDE